MWFVHEAGRRCGSRGLWAAWFIKGAGTMRCNTLERGRIISRYGKEHQ